MNDQVGSTRRHLKSDDAIPSEDENLEQSKQEFRSPLGYDSGMVEHDIYHVQDTSRSSTSSNERKKNVLKSQMESNYSIYSSSNDVTGNNCTSGGKSPINNYDPETPPVAASKFKTPFIKMGNMNDISSPAKKSLKNNLIADKK